MKWRTLVPRLLPGILLLGHVSIAVGNQGPAMQAIKVEISDSGGKYQLLRDGKPYLVKGAGIDHIDLQSLVDHGGNSIRTWAVDDGPEPAQQLLDKAHALGLTVSLCLEFARERQGFDYNDPIAVARQAAETRARVLKYKDHPALLTWIIGNELNFDFENPRVYEAVNTISKMIHELDPNHPTTTTIASFDKKALAAIDAYAPDLDFLSFQLYGDLINLPMYIEQANFDKPYFVTEWGAVGHWEVWKTQWGAPVEQTSSEKADNYARSYRRVLQPFADQAIGNYVFLWGQKQEKTPTWYGMYLESGEETETIDVMQHIWTGQWPDNRTPRVSPITLDDKMASDNVTLSQGKPYVASLEVMEWDNDPVSYRWEVRSESSAENIGGDHEEVPHVIGGLIQDPTASDITMTAPEAGGAYRLFVYVYDGQNHAAHANIPFFVE
jgi:hypothetical protein